MVLYVRQPHESLAAHIEEGHPALEEVRSIDEGSRDVPSPGLAAARAYATDAIPDVLLAAQVHGR